MSRSIEKPVVSAPSPAELPLDELLTGNPYDFEWFFMSGFFGKPNASVPAREVELGAERNAIAGTVLEGGAICVQIELCDAAPGRPATQAAKSPTSAANMYRVVAVRDGLEIVTVHASIECLLKKDGVQNPDRATAAQIADARKWVAMAVEFQRVSWQRQLTSVWTARVAAFAKTATAIAPAPLGDLKQALQDHLDTLGSEVATGWQDTESCSLYFRKLRDPDAVERTRWGSDMWKLITVEIAEGTPSWVVESPQPPAATSRRAAQ